MLASTVKKVKNIVEIIDLTEENSKNDTKEIKNINEESRCDRQSLSTSSKASAGCQVSEIESTDEGELQEEISEYHYFELKRKRKMTQNLTANHEVTCSMSKRKRKIERIIIKITTKTRIDTKSSISQSSTIIKSKATLVKKKYRKGKHKIKCLTKKDAVSTHTQIVPSLTTTSDNKKDDSIIIIRDRPLPQCRRNCSYHTRYSSKRSMAHDDIQENKEYVHNCLDNITLDSISSISNNDYQYTNETETSLSSTNLVTEPDLSSQLQYTPNNKLSVRIRPTVFKNITDRPVGTVKPMPAQKSLKQSDKEEPKFLPKAMNVQVGGMLNEHYEITEIVKYGSYSNIIRVLDKQSNSTKLLKMMHARQFSNMFYHTSRLNEADTKMDRHCIRLHGIIYVNGHLAMWLEDYKWNLQEMLEKMGPDVLPLCTVQILGRQLLTAVQFCKEMNILHLNVTPKHILLNATSSLQLTGFDGSVSKDKQTDFTATPPFNYHAPELILNRGADYSCDVWSSACVLYEMATKKKLFGGDTEFDVLKGINKDILNRQENTFRRNIDDELSAVYETNQNVNSTNWTLVYLLSTALKSMLIINPNKRISIDSAIKNMFFDFN